ncbi:MAG: hypothetical protein EOP84_33540 [Verrucomicrobiaceae bacterium]|nr:MAG: hypothetical protein EOP84_33540 [Verrucomicrobiaceae bacterium]
MATTTCTTVDGMLLHDSRGGDVPDSLVSVVQTKDASGTVTSETEYWIDLEEDLEALSDFASGLF